MATRFIEVKGKQDGGILANTYTAFYNKNKMATRFIEVKIKKDGGPLANMLHNFQQ